MINSIKVNFKGWKINPLENWVLIIVEIWYLKKVKIQEGEKIIKDLKKGLNNLVKRT